MAENGREWPRMAENGNLDPCWWGFFEWPRMAENGREWALADLKEVFTKTMQILCDFFAAYCFSSVFFFSA